MRDDIDARRRDGKVAREHVGRPARRRDQERSACNHLRVPTPPLLDVDRRDRRLFGKASRAQRRIGLATAEAAVGARERHRRAREPQIVHGNPVGQVESAQRVDEAFAARRKMMDVHHRDVERRRNRADEVAPALVRAPDELERSRALAVGVVLDAPAIADCDGEIMATRASRRRDQRSCMLLGAATAVQHVQHAGDIVRMRTLRDQRGIADRSQRIGRDIRANEIDVVRMARYDERKVGLAELCLLGFEGAAADVNDERVVAQHVAPSGARRPQAQIVFLAIASAERRIERADRIDQRATHVHAEADAGRQIGICRHRRTRERRARSLGRFGVGCAVVDTESRVRADLGVVRERRDRADRRVRCGAARKGIEPAGGDDRVRVEQHDIRTRVLHAAVRRVGEAGIALVAKQMNVRKRPLLDFGEQPGDRRVGRAVVDQHQTVVRRVRKNALDAARDVGRGVVDRHDDVDRIAHIGCARDCGPVHAPRSRCSASFARSNGSRSHQPRDCRWAMMRSCAASAASRRP